MMSPEAPSESLESFEKNQNRLRLTTIGLIVATALTALHGGYEIASDVKNNESTDPIHALELFGSAFLATGATFTRDRYNINKRRVTEEDYR